jgi:adenylate cyclase
MHILESALERAVEGHPQVVGLVAEAGTGKSRLTFEFTERCRARGIPVSTGQGVSHGKSIPMLPLLEELRGSFGISERDSPRRVRQKIAGALVLLDRKLEESAPLIFDLFGVPDPERPAPRLLPEQRQSRVFAVLRRALHARSRQTAAVTLLEDLHWFDPTSVVFLGSLIEAIQGTRSLLLLTFRPEFQAEWMGRSEYQQISLQPLGREAVGELLGDLLGRDASLEGLDARIFDVTGGNPFFVEEVVQELVESRRLEGNRGSYRLREPLDAIAVPGSVQALLAARIDRLPERDKQLLQTAAVVGKECSEALLRRVSDLPDLELSEALQQLRSAELVYQAELYPESVWAFKHALTREVAYRSQLGERRRRLHASVARALEKGDATGSERSFALLAHHWEEAGARLEAARAHMRAARQVILDDFEEPVGRWQRVCDLLAELPETPETIGMELRARSWLLYMAWPTGRSHQEMRDVFTRARELAQQTGSQESLVEVQTHFGRLLRIGGKVEEGAELIRDAHRRAEGIESSRIRGEVVTAFADLLIDLGRCEESLAEVRRLLTVLSTAATVTTRANLHYCEASALLWLGRPREGLRVAQDALTMALKDADLRAQNILTLQMSGLAELTGEWELVLDRTREEIDIVERHGGTATLASAYLSHASACLLAGELDRAEPALTHALELTGYPRLPYALASPTLLRLSQVHLAQGHLAEAERLASEAVAEAHRLKQLGNEAWSRIELARVLLATGDLTRASAAREALDSAATILRGADLGRLQPLLHLGRAELAQLTGDGEARRRELASALRIYRDWGNRREVERISRELEAK